MSNLNQPGAVTDRVSVDAAGERLAQYLEGQTGAAVSLESIERLSGGAIQENWLLRAQVNGEARRWVLRTDSPSAVASSMTRAQEFAVLGAAHRAGVKVPEPLWLCRDDALLGRDFFIMQALAGTASGFRLTGDRSLDDARPQLCRELGANLARLHRIQPSEASLDFLPPPASEPIQHAIDQCRGFLDEIPGCYPALEWGLRWCEVHKPRERPANLIHRDYRTGNYMVDQGRLTGVLDWEFTGWGDAREDLGWFTARCWRFARHDREAGGMGELEDFLGGYREVAGWAPTAAELVYWQVLAHLRWAVIALQQAQRHLSGQQSSLELALTGRMVPELEHEILALTGAPQ
ncbi:Phosphotransferase enzyme family protein [compost metagenome]